MFINRLKEKIHHEYWPWWLFYLPMVPVWLFWAIRNRSFTWFTATNTNMPAGGFFGESKHDILLQIPEKYRPKHVLVQPGETLFSVLQQLENQGIGFPVVAKPNVGERGNGVAKIDSKEGLALYFHKTVGPFIVQQCIDFPVELGVFFVKMPFEPFGRVTSITMKEFLQVCGDGESSISELLEADIRGSRQLETIAERTAVPLGTIPSLGEKVLLEPIGNHCRGTKFLDTNYLINNHVHLVFNEIVASMPGFFFGRFDLKVNSIEDLNQDKNIAIMELNGASSEPGHVYDPQISLFQAYRDLLWHWNQLGKIASQNRKRGVKPTPLVEVIKMVWEHFFGQPEMQTNQEMRSQSSELSLEMKI